MPPELETPARATALLSVRGLAIDLPLKSGSTRVVDQVSFDVGPGETLGIVGESGCGKSVTAMSLIGLVPGGGKVVGGEILFDGVSLQGLSARAWRDIRGKRIALISQEPMTSLDPSYTVMNQLVETIRTHRPQSRRSASAKALELLTVTGIKDPPAVAMLYPHQISGGMAQRVVIARALAGEPELLIADEPTTALDSTVQREILILLRRIQLSTGMAIVLVTHDWGVVSEMCDRAVVMYAGQIMESASLDRLIPVPLHPYTHALLAANPHLVSSTERVKTIEGRVPAPAEWPVGCRFADRCPLADQACRESPVPLFPVADDRESRCIHVDRLAVLENAE